MWIAANGEELRVGDLVALPNHPDEVGRIKEATGDHTGRPRVEITAGPRLGKTVDVWPGEILLKVIPR
jgi:hypothetical protein